MRKSDSVPVLVIVLLASAVVTLFFQGGRATSEVQVQASYTITTQGWGQVQQRH